MAQGYWASKQWAAWNIRRGAGVPEHVAQGARDVSGFRQDPQATIPALRRYARTH
jgi:hypothetical protein